MLLELDTCAAVARVLDIAASLLDNNTRKAGSTPSSHAVDKTSEKIPPPAPTAAAAAATSTNLTATTTNSGTATACSLFGEV